MTEHTPEPWVVIENPDRWGFGYLVQQNGQTICSVAWREFADQIVNSVNACAGIPTEQLEAGSVAELVAAGAEFAQGVGLTGWHNGAGIISERRTRLGLLDRFRAAIAPFQKD